MFLPPVMNDEWTEWIAGRWEGTGESDSGKGSGTIDIELALSGQFLVFRGEAKISELNPEYLKEHMQATDEEIERFRRSGYQSLELYTADPETGEVIGFLFDNLRCMAKGRGKREGFKEVIAWEWHNGHRSTPLPRESARTGWPSPRGHPSPMGA